MKLFQILNFSLVILLTPGAVLLAAEEEPVPAEISIGERLFIETRFAQAYAVHPDKADPAMQYSLTLGKKLPGPFAGKTMNCRSCHMVDEHAETVGAGMRSYADFAEKTPIPARNDGKKTTGRNSMSLVNIMLPPTDAELFHFDGEFNSMEDLVRATLTGRNYGWLAKEHDAAVKHIAAIIRNDDGNGELAKEFGGSYKKILAGKDRSIPAKFVLPESYRVDVVKASDTEIVDKVASLITAYVADLNFSKDEQGRYNASPYDKFLQLNRLPQKPLNGESNTAYAERLTAAVNDLQAPRYLITNAEKFATHKQDFKFGRQELQGLKLFLTKGTDKQRGGNCVSCHTPPDFTDFGFHNTGVVQKHYDATHGAGAFVTLTIPDLATRNKDYNAFLPATAKHPEAKERFRSAVNKKTPGNVDLGAWNVFANPDIPAPQAKLKALFCKQAKLAASACTEDALLPITIATFKTPSLRDLGHSEPYMHSGAMHDLSSVLTHYIATSALAKAGKVRNADEALSSINLSAEDIKTLEAFLHALNEDYD